MGDKTKPILKALWAEAVKSNCVDSLSPEERAGLVAALRETACKIEDSPQDVVGMLMFIATKKTSANGDVGVKSRAAVVGSTPAIAAHYILFEQDGQTAVSQVLPQILLSALQGATDEPCDCGACNAGGGEDRAPEPKQAGCRSDLH